MMVAAVGCHFYSITQWNVCCYNINKIFTSYLPCLLSSGVVVRVHE
jgi:hypothetical protein